MSRDTIDNAVIPVMGYVHNERNGRNYGLSHAVIGESGHRAVPGVLSEGEIVVACGFPVKSLNSGIFPEPTERLCQRCKWVVEQRRVKIPQREDRIVNEDRTLGWIEKVHGYDPRRLCWLVEDEGGEFFEVEPAGGVLEYAGENWEPVRRRDDLDKAYFWFKESA